jgi:mannose-6-phosphate isomerase-like protein (cupin superfamily)
MTQTVSQQGLQSFKYEAPSSLDTPKAHFALASRKILGLRTQGLRTQGLSSDGGETNLHAHTNQDSAWFVLAVAACFVDKADKVFELGMYEAVSIRMGTPYWFESASDEPLEIMRVAAVDPTIASDRVNYAAFRGRESEDELAGRAPTAEELVRLPASRSRSTPDDEECPVGSGRSFRIYYETPKRLE